MYPIIINGQRYEFPNREDALIFAMEHSRDFLGKKSSSATRQKAAHGSSPPGQIKLARDFLSAIRNAGERGCTTERIMKAVGIGSAVAFGNRGKNINRLLSQLGFEDRYMVYTNERNERGDREWKPGPKLDQAMDALNKLGGA